MPLHILSTMCSSSGGQNCIIQHLVSSHWNKWVVKNYESTILWIWALGNKIYVWIFQLDYCILLTINMLCRGYIYPVVKVIGKVLCLFTLHVWWVCLVIKSYKLLISCCIHKVTYIRLLNLLKMYDVYLHYLSKKVAFIQLLILFGVHLLYVNCRIYRKCSLTVVKAKIHT